MADFSTLIATLQATIKTNYNQEITGQILQDDLLAIVDAVNRLKQDTLEGYAFHGAPLADGASVSVTQNTFFLVAEGEYTINGSTIEVDAAGVSVIVYDSVNNTTNWYTLFAYDTTPTANSRKAITSGAVKAALDLKADKSTTYTKTETDTLLNGKQDTLTFDNTPTEDSLNPVTSGGIFDAIESAVDGLANIIGTKQPKDTDAVAGNVAVMDAGGSSVDGGVALADLATKAEVEAVEQEVAQVAGEAGLAEAVIDTDGVGAEQEFTFRKSGGDGGAYYRKIKGKTIVVDDQLASNDAEAVETTGANQWDEEWRNDGWWNNSGEWVSNPNYLSSKNKIKVLAGQTYHYKFPANGYIRYYDANGNYIDSYITSRTEDNIIIPNGVSLIVFSLYFSGGATYNHDICINISNPAINGQYFPYWKRTLQLGITTRKDTDGNVPFPNGLQSCPVAQDEATKEGGTIRVGTRAYQAGDESDADVITDGTNTNYALATPVPFTWAEPLNLGVKVDENGTERAVAPEGATAPSAPFVADTTYTMSVARMVEKLQNL